MKTTPQPRELVLAGEVNRMSAAQLIAAIIGSGSKDNSVQRLSHDVALHMQQQHWSMQSLMSIKGIHLAKAAALMAAWNLRGAVQNLHEAKRLLTAELVYQSCHDIIQSQQEHCMVVYVSSRNTQIKRSLVSIGTVSASLVHPREVFREAIIEGASALVVAHNHPSGSMQPSNADISITRTLVEAGKIIDICVLDHVICSTKGYLSMKLGYPHLF